MIERGNGESMDGRLRKVTDDVELLAGTLIVVQTEVQELQRRIRGVDGLGLYDRVMLMDDSLQRLLVWQSDVVERLPPEDAPSMVARLDALDAAIASIRQWQAVADERLDWRRRPAAE